MKHRLVRSGSVLMLTGVFAIAAALLLTAKNAGEQSNAENAAAEVLSKMEFDTPLASEDIGEAVIPDYVLNPDMDMPSETIDGSGYVGKLEIPALNISLPVREDWSYKELKKSPCRYTGSIYKNDMVIAGHNYTSHFGGLKNLSIGDEVVFTDIDGNIFYYTVAETEILAPDKVEEMTDGKYPLTLFTCTVGGKSRVTIRCEEKQQLSGIKQMNAWESVVVGGVWR